MDDRLRCTDAAGLARAFHTKRVGFRGHTFKMDFQIGQLTRTWHPVIHHRPRQELTGIRVVCAVLTKRLPNPLHQTALYLPDRQHRIDQVAVVVNGDIAQQFDGTGLRIDLDLRRLTAVREGKRYVLVKDKSVEAAIPCLCSHIGQADGLSCRWHAEGAIRKCEIRRLGLE